MEESPYTVFVGLGVVAQPLGALTLVLAWGFRGASHAPRSAGDLEKDHAIREQHRYGSPNATLAKFYVSLIPDKSRSRAHPPALLPPPPTHTFIA